MADAAPLIVWFRSDLRIADNPALTTALATGRPVIPLYILDDETPGRWRPGGAARWWLHHSLQALDTELRERGAALVLRRGAADVVIDAVATETGAAGVCWNRCYEPHTIARDSTIKDALKGRGLDGQSFNGSLLFEPWSIRTKQGGFYKVYTRFWQACRAQGDPGAPLPAPDKLSSFEGEVHSERLDDWALLPTTPDWSKGLHTRWQPGAAGAMDCLRAFLESGLVDYAKGRDFPGRAVTSNLSPFLHAGDISPRQVWHETLRRVGWTAAAEKFLKEIVWREFAYHVFYHLPDLPDVPMHARFSAFPWADDDGLLTCWQQGRTGYPLVDAGMRELWQTGHMHNRVRMVTASFLVKHLLLPWQAGEAWFWDTLVDADLAVNAFSWQWVAGCGADAAPFFRIFNPIIQGSKFDPDGAYIRTYVPEIAGLADKYLFAPWEAPDHVLKDAGIKLGETYPKPIVDHKRARARALDAFKSLPQSAGT
jgi:deoxyribodipyrimidine photo-lyase